MAISHAHLTLLLLLSFFWLPTLLAIPFTDCGNGSSPVKVTSVDMIKDKTMGSFQISGSTSKIISGGHMNVTITVAMKVIILKETFDLCEYITCPLAPGAFVLPFNKMFPLHSPMRFHISVKIFEDSDDYKEGIMCLNFDFQTEQPRVMVT